MIHLTAQQLSSYMDGELNEVSTELVRRHMGICEECTLKFAALEVQEEHLSQALVHEPGEEFFDRFAADVERQLPTGKEWKRGGASSPAGRAADMREAARHSGASAPFPLDDDAVEVDRSAGPVRQAALARPAAEPVSVASSPPTPPPEDDEGGESDFDDDVVLAELSLGRPVSVEPPVMKPPTARPPATDAAPRSSELKTPARPPATAPPPSMSTPSRPAPHSRPAARPVQRRPVVRRPAPSVPWYAAAILALIAGAAGVVVSRTDPVSAWLDHNLKSLIPGQESPTAVDTGSPVDAPSQETSAHELSTGAESTADGETPSPDAETSDEDFEPKPQSADWFLPPASSAIGRDPFAELPAMSLAQVRAAQRSKAAADASPSAARYEAAAVEWERTIPLLRGERQQSLGRLELASSRYRAWENAPTEARAAAAASAIRIYLTLAPSGAPRDLVKNWLARVSG